MIDILKGEINFLKSAWQNLLGRPLVTLVLKNSNLGRLNIYPDIIAHMQQQQPIIVCLVCGCMCVFCVCFVCVRVCVFS